MSNDSTKALNTPIVKGGLERIPFFNGRVLTAEDLQTEQDANETERKRLGRALGTGVLEGLFIDRGSGDPPTTVTVESGRALAPSGRVVELPSDIKLSILSEIDRAETAGTKGQFDDCSTERATFTTGSGAYLLVIGQADETQKRVPRARLGSDGGAEECGAKYRVEGARFNLVHLDISNPDLVPTSLRGTVREKARAVKDRIDEGEEPAPNDVSMLRNVLAHICLGTPDSSTETARPHDMLRSAARGEEAAPTDPVAALRANDQLAEDSVPLGLLYWAGDRIAFVDAWSVRRRVHRSGLQRPTHATDRRRAEAEAAVYQFHNHVNDLQSQYHQMSQVPAGTLFSYLPPIGIIPPVERTYARFPTPAFPQSAVTPPPIIGRGPQIESVLPIVPEFFTGLTVKGRSFLEPQRMRALVDEMLRYPPLSLKAAFPPDPRRENEPGPLIWLYRLAPNSLKDDDQQPFIFTSGYAPFLGKAQFNLSRADRATFSSTAGPPGGS